MAKRKVKMKCKECGTEWIETFLEGHSCYAVCPGPMDCPKSPPTGEIIN